MKSIYADYHNLLTEQVVTPFYEKRLESLREMTLTKILKKKNPYLLKAKNLTSPEEVVRSIVDAFLSSQEETIFGNLLENFAVYVAAKLYNGFKSKLPSIDLEFERDKIYYIVGIKSGVNWGNADQVSKMRDNFVKAKKLLREKGITLEIIAVNGCMYGKDSKPLKDKNKGNLHEPDQVYYKYAGQDFWQFITGDDNFYLEIIKPIDEKARERDEVFKKTYIGKINEMSSEFGNNFLAENGLIDWLKLVDFISKRGKTEKIGKQDD